MKKILCAFTVFIIALSGVILLAIGGVVYIIVRKILIQRRL